MPSTQAHPFEVKQCASCGAAVIWTFTHKGNKMQVDATPVENGNIRLREYKGVVISEYDGEEHPSLFDDPQQPR